MALLVSTSVLEVSLTCKRLKSVADPGAQEWGVGLRRVEPSPRPPLRLVKIVSLKKSIAFTLALLLSE